MYFQEILENEKCEILKPFFITDTPKISIKDYIEVNSAIALALQGLEYGVKDVNFKKQTFNERLNNSLAKLNIGKSEDSGSGKTKGKLNLDLGGSFDLTETWLLRTLGGLFILIIVYTSLSLFINRSIESKNEQLAYVKEDTQNKINLVMADIKKVNSKTSDYESLSENLKNISNEVSENNKNRNNIPNLLSEIMYAIPKGVQITSIENTTSKHIIIQAQSEKYEQLGYFKAILRTKGILSPDTIVSSPGEKTENLVKVVIEGDLP